MSSPQISPQVRCQSFVLREYQAAVQPPYSFLTKTSSLPFGSLSSTLIHWFCKANVAPLINSLRRIKVCLVPGGTASSAAASIRCLISVFGHPIILQSLHFILHINFEIVNKRYCLCYIPSMWQIIKKIFRSLLQEILHGLFVAFDIRLSSIFKCVVITISFTKKNWICFQCFLFCYLDHCCISLVGITLIVCPVTG